MTTPSECFKKQVKANACSAFNMFIKGIIMGWPMIVFAVYWFSLPAPEGYSECVCRVLLLCGGMIISSVVMLIYDWVIAVPLINCFFGEDI
jgi:hypothetical protein